MRRHPLDVRVAPLERRAGDSRFVAGAARRQGTTRCGRGVDGQPHQPHVARCRGSTSRRHRAPRRPGRVDRGQSVAAAAIRRGRRRRPAIEAPSYAANGEETFKLRDADHERPLLIKVGEPSPTLTASMLQRLDLLHRPMPAPVRRHLLGGQRLDLFGRVRPSRDLGRDERAGGRRRLPHHPLGQPPRSRTQETSDDRFLSLRDRARAGAVPHRGGPSRAPHGRDDQSPRPHVSRSADGGIADGGDALAGDRPGARSAQRLRSPRAGDPLAALRRFAVSPRFPRIERRADRGPPGDAGQ